MALCRLYTATPRFWSTLHWFAVLPRFYSRFEVDVLDQFTTHLMQKKIVKWDQKKRQNDIFLESHISKLTVKPHKISVQIENLGNHQILTLFQNALDNEDTQSTLRLTKDCLQHKKPIPVKLLIGILSVCAQCGEKDVIMQIQEQFKQNNPKLMEENSNFNHFLAEAIWIKGDISKALTMFEEIYRESAYLRCRIRLTFKYLSTILISSGSEAALSNMINFCKRILKDFQDPVPLTYMWQACLSSEWFVDQSKALELLEQHPVLLKSVIPRIPYVVHVSLKCHRTEVVYRLLEVLLKYQMKSQYSIIIGALLDYQFRSGNWAECSEIVNWAVNNDVQLPPKGNIKIILTLLNQKMKTPLVEVEEKEKEKYDFKF